MPANRKSKLSDFNKNSVISFLNEIPRRLNALSTPFYTLYVAHANFSVETMPANRKSKLSNFDKISVISFLIVIFRRLNALSFPFYTPNVAHANFSDKSIPANRKTESFKFRRTPDCDISAFKFSPKFKVCVLRVARTVSTL
jgi:hypothetical protein